MSAIVIAIATVTKNSHSDSSIMTTDLGRTLGLGGAYFPNVCFSPVCIFVTIFFTVPIFSQYWPAYFTNLCGLPQYFPDVFPLVYQYFPDMSSWCNLLPKRLGKCAAPNIGKILAKYAETLGFLHILPICSFPRVCIFSQYFSARSPPVCIVSAYFPNLWAGVLGNYWPLKGTPKNIERICRTNIGNILVKYAHDLWNRPPSFCLIRGLNSSNSKTVVANVIIVVMLA